MDTLSTNSEGQEAASSNDPAAVSEETAGETAQEESAGEGETAGEETEQASQAAEQNAADGTAAEATEAVIISEVTGSSEDTPVNYVQGDTVAEEESNELWDDNNKWKIAAYDEKELLMIQAAGDGYAGRELIDKEYVFTGSSVGSMIQIEKTVNGTTDEEIAILGVIQDGKGIKYYTYCVDLSVGGNGGSYEQESLSKIDKDRLTHNEDGKAAEKLALIAENGYWDGKAGGNTASTVSAWLKSDCGYTGDAELKDGEAMALTQALIWYYGNSGTNNAKMETSTSPFVGTLLVTEDDYNTTKLTEIFNYMVVGDSEGNDGLSKALAAKEESIKANKAATSLLDESSISAEVTINSINSDGSIASAADCTADIDVKLNVDYQKETDDLFITVTVTGQEPVKYRISGVKEEGETLTYIPITEDGTVSIKGVTFDEDGKIGLELTGTQYYNDNATVLTNVVGYNSSQSLIIVQPHEYNVDLKMDIAIDVEAIKTPEEPVVGVSGSYAMSDSPKTGDSSFVWFCLLLSSAAALPLPLLLLLKRRTEK